MMLRFSKIYLKGYNLIVEKTSFKLAINLFNIITDVEKTLLPKGPSFIPNPTNINWFNLERDFDNFVNRLRCMAI